MKINDAHYCLDSSLKLSNAVERLTTTMEENEVASTLVVSLVDEPWAYKDFCLQLNDMSGVKYMREIEPKQKYERDLDEILNSNAIGIKLHPRLRKFNLNHKDVHNIVDRVSGLNLLIGICAFWDGTWNRYGLDTEDFADLADAYPDQKFIWAHSGGHKVLDFMMMARRRNNVFLDTSYTQHYFYGGSVLSDLTYSLNSLSDKFVFGSDFENRSYKETLGTVITRYTSLGLSAENLYKIMYSNYEKLISVYD